MSPGRDQPSDLVGSRPSLRSPDLAPLWGAVRARLERTGVDRRGRMRVPELAPRGRFILDALLDRPARSTFELTELEAALRRLGVGADLSSALTALGWPVDAGPEARRSVRREAAAARDAVRQAAGSWRTPGGQDWVEAVIRAGLLAGRDPTTAVALVERARAVLDTIDRGQDAGGSPLSRVDLAASVLGSAHALDWGNPETAAVTRALELRHLVKGRAAWEAAGVDLDVVSAPVLVWGLTPASGGLSTLLGAAREAGVPVHLSLLALRRHRVAVPAGSDVLVSENPRVVEAAAQQETCHAAVALNGNPSSAAQLLLAQLRDAGAVLRYHGDFDAAGLRICARMQRFGLIPWRMDAADYSEATARARAERAELPLDPHRAPPTPWCPQLQEAFDSSRRIVHEERLLPGLLDPPTIPTAPGR